MRVVDKAINIDLNLVWSDVELARQALVWLSEKFGDDLKAKVTTNIIVLCELRAPGQESVLEAGETRSEALGRAVLEMAKQCGWVEEHLKEIGILRDDMADRQCERPV